MNRLFAVPLLKDPMLGPPASELRSTPGAVDPTLAAPEQLHTPESKDMS